MYEEQQREVLQHKLKKMISSHMKTYKCTAYDAWKIIDSIAFENIVGYLDE